MGRIHVRLGFSTLAARLAELGCAMTQSVRYVYQDRDYGVRMPENTNRWPTHFHRKAEKMMGQHFPEGYEIVRRKRLRGLSNAQDRGLEDGRNQSSNSGRNIKDREAGDQQPESGGYRQDQGVPHYHGCADRAEENAFSPDVECTPTRYLDPNDAERKKPAVHETSVAKPDNSKVG